MTKKHTLLLTGGTGMVGENVREHPHATDWHMVAPSSTELNLCDAHAVNAFVQGTQPDVIIHAAGRVGGIESNMTRMVDYLDINMSMGRNIVMAARDHGVKRLINLGSTCMYPREATNPLHEESLLTGALEPTNEGYALAKSMVQRLCQYICTESPEYRYITLIPCNLYGRYDKYDPNHSHLLAAIIHKIHTAMKNGAKTVNIWGSGTARREFLYAGDLADAILRAVHDLFHAPDKVPAVMNISHGMDYTINECYEAVGHVLGWQGTFTHDMDKPVGIAKKLSAIHRQTAWGWAPKTPLHEGIAAAYAFYCDHIDDAGMRR